MIRAWFRRRRALPPANLPLDPTVIIGAQIDVRDGQIEGLRDALAEAHRRLADERRRNAVLLGELATYKTRDYAAHAARARRRLAEEPTLRTSVEQFQRTRPAAETERWTR